jgi:hypothetical protein
MKLPLLLTMVVLVSSCLGQQQADLQDVDNLKLIDVSATVVRLTWASAESACDVPITYSVYRGTTEDFVPSLNNRIANHLRRTTYLDKRVNPQKGYFYYVKVVQPDCSVPEDNTQPDSHPEDITGQSAQVNFDVSHQQPAFPSTAEITLLLSQAERSFNEFEGAIKMEEAELGTQSARDSTFETDRQLLKSFRNLLPSLKKNPQQFNGPLGFLLIGDLDDASRNMALCTGQGYGLAGASIAVQDVSTAKSKMLAAETCRGVSQLLYSVSESAFNLYASYLSSNEILEQRLSNTVGRCAEILKTQSR